MKDINVPGIPNDKFQELLQAANISSEDFSHFSVLTELSKYISLKIEELQKYQKIIDKCIFPSPIQPICLCVDTSVCNALEEGDNKLENIKNIILEFIQDLEEYADDGDIRHDIAIMAIDQNATFITDFLPITTDNIAPYLEDLSLHEGKQISLSLGISFALVRLDTQLKKYQEQGLDCYPPVLVTLIDNKNIDETISLDTAIDKIIAMNKKKKVIFLPFYLYNHPINTGLSPLFRFNPSVLRRNHDMFQTYKIANFADDNPIYEEDENYFNRKTSSFLIEDDFFANWDEPLY